jgi:Ca2+-binding EF-hand superfamily protein
LNNHLIFRAYDTDGDGKVSKDEVRLCMMNFGQHFSDRDIEKLVKIYDEDNDGFLEFHEFVNMLSKIDN